MTYKKISAFAKVRRGASPRPIEAPRYFGGNVGWVRIADVTASNKYLKSTAQYLSPLGEKFSVRVDKGDLVMSIAGTVGRPILIDMPACIHDGFVQIYNMHNTDVEYLYYYLKFIEESLKSLGQSGTQINLNTHIVENINIYHPDKSTQEKIAEVLSTIDRAIAQTEALIAKHQRIKTGLMQDLLTRGIDEHGQLRDESTHKFKSTPLGMIPVEWEESNLGKIGHRITSGSRGWARYYSDSGAKFIRIGSLTREHVNLRYENLQYVQPPDSSETKRTVLETGDLLISITADLGIIGVVPHDLGEAYINQHIALVKLDKESFNPYFVGNLLSGFQAQKYFSNLNDSGAKAGLNLKTIAAFPVVFPKKEEQDRIAEIILKADKIIQAKKIERKKLLGIKTGLMQDLLSGEVSVTPLLEG